MRLVAALLALALPACREGRPPAKDASDARPDVVLLVVDTLRAKSLSTLGYDRPTSPEITRFAGDAIAYTRAISPGTWTVPAHGSLFTGLLPSYHGAERVVGGFNLATPINPDVETLAEILARHGYRTGGFAANSTYLTPSLGFGRGFARYVPHDARADVVAGLALDWFAATPRPAFLFVNLLDPHEPYDPPAPWDARFPGKRAELGTKLTDLYWAGTPLRPDMLEHFRSQYDGEVAFTDRVLGDLFARLRKAGRYDEALIILTADHGEILGEHGLAGHGCAPFEELVHVPLLVKYPGNRDGGKRVDRRVSTVGVFATVLAAAGIPLPSEVPSAPLDEPHPVWVEDIDNAGFRVTVGYAGERKLVHQVKPDGGEESARVYDLAADPREERPAAPAAAPALAAEVARFRAAPRPTNAAPAPVIDAERERKLRELGYLR